MLLFDVFYRGQDFDSNIPLPEPKPDVRYAVCTNGETMYLIPHEGRWVPVGKPVALARRNNMENYTTPTAKDYLDKDGMFRVDLGLWIDDPRKDDALLHLDMWANEQQVSDALDSYNEVYGGDLIASPHDISWEIVSALIPSLITTPGVSLAD